MTETTGIAAITGDGASPGVPGPDPTGNYPTAPAIVAFSGNNTRRQLRGAGLAAHSQSPGGAPGEVRRKIVYVQ